MTYESKNSRWKKILRNSAVLGGIACVSNLIATGGFSWGAVWTALLTGGLVALIEVKHAYQIIPFKYNQQKSQTTFFLP